MVKPDAAVYIFIGNEEYLKKNAIDKLRSCLMDRAAEKFDYKIFYGGESDVREILDYASTFPFTAAKRFVVVKDFENLHERERARLVDYIKKPSKTTTLVLDSKDDSILKEYSYIARYAVVSRFGISSDLEVSSSIKGFLSNIGKGIDDDALEILKESCGQSLSYLMGELDKLAVFVGDRPTIEIGDVESLASGTSTSSVFEISRAIGEAKVDRALEILYELVLGGKRPSEIIGILSWHLKRISKALMLKSKGHSHGSILNNLKIPRRYANEFLKQLSSFGAYRLQSKLNILLETDLEIKSSRYDPRMVLEFGIIRLCL